MPVRTFVVRHMSSVPLLLFRGEWGQADAVLGMENGDTI